MKNDISMPLGASVASAATFIGNAVLHYWTYGNDPEGFFPLRFFGMPALVTLISLVPAATVLMLRLWRHRRAVRVRRGAAYRWLIGGLVLLGILATFTFTGTDDSGYWMLVVLFFTPTALLISATAGITLMIALTALLKRWQRG